MWSIRHLKLATFWLTFSLLLELACHQSTWNGIHIYGQYNGWQLLGVFSTWTHIDLAHGVNNLLFGIWLFIQVEARLGFKWGLFLALGIAIDLFIVEELVHLWIGLPPSQGSSAWLYAHLPFCMYWAFKLGWWKQRPWWLGFGFFVIGEDVLFLIFSGNFMSYSTLFHGVGFLMGCLWAIVLIKLDIPKICSR